MSESGTFGFMSRRRFLKVGLAAGGAVAAAGGGLFALRGRAPQIEGLRLLDDHEYRTLTNLARTHIPAGGPFEAGADEVDLARAFDDFLADEPEENIDDLRAALMLIELGPVIFEARLATFSNLTPEAQLEHWKGWMHSRLLLRRQASLAFRKFFGTVFYDRMAVWPAIGYPGPVMGATPP